MILYIEKQARHYPLTHRIIAKFSGAHIVEINHYKNIFDKRIGDFPTENCLILARLTGDHISLCPTGYDEYDFSYFFKTSLNCVFDCDYCYLKGAFRNNFRVVFVNYDEIMETLSKKISETRAKYPESSLIFYASDYSDVQATDNITEFNVHFIPFFEQFDRLVVESRTKSANITSLLALPEVPKNFEIAFSLNPDEIIEKYEHKSARLDDRIRAINALIERGFKVGLRFLPLLPLSRYEQIYEDFLQKVTASIPLQKVHSFSVGSLLYTKEDYKNMIKKVPKFDILYHIETMSDDGFVRLPLDVRIKFYKLFRKYLGEFSVCLDGKVVKNLVTENSQH